MKDLTMPTRFDNVTTLAFDLFGTVLDWRSSLIAEGKRIAGHLTPQPDWEAFAVAWSKGYAKQVGSLTEWANLDGLLRKAFYEIADDFDLGRLNRWVRIDLADAWCRLNPWPDAMDGLSRLGKLYVLATLSNANHEMQQQLAEHTGLPWYRYLSAEDAGCYKPCPKVYTQALATLKAEPGQVILVAAHTFDLNAAHALGFRTALIERPSEPGSSRKGLDHEADFIVPDIAALADAMLAN